MGSKRKQAPVSYYPLLLDLRNKSVVVVGGGRVAERKIKTLLACQARVRLISPHITRGLEKLARQKRFKWQPRTFRHGDLGRALMVFAATNDPALNHRIAAQLKATPTLVNVANLPGESNFLVPAVVRRGKLLIAISTSGDSPALARKIRRELEQTFGQEFSTFIKTLGRVRKALMARIPSLNRRKRILNRLIQSEVLDLLRSGHLAAAKNRAREITGLKKKDF